MRGVVMLLVTSSYRKLGKAFTDLTRALVVSYESLLDSPLVVAVWCSIEGFSIILLLSFTKFWWLIWRLWSASSLFTLSHCTPNAVFDPIGASLDIPLPSPSSKQITSARCNFAWTDSPCICGNISAKPMSFSTVPTWTVLDSRPV